MTAPLRSVICANIGILHEPVSRAFPPNVAVPKFVFEYAVGTLIKSPPGNVVTSVLTEAEEEKVVLAPPVPVVRLNGEQPTKFGAVEFTAVHSWILNWIAAVHVSWICQ